MTATSDHALVVRGLRASRGAREVLRGVDLSVAPGELCALMGVSGAGKSTVLRAVAALQPFSDGSITVGDPSAGSGQAPSQGSGQAFALAPGPVPPESRLRPLRRKVGMVFQSQSLFEHLTALDNVTLAPVHALGWTRARAEEVARGLLDALGVAARADAFPRQLSGGEAQRVAIARALAPGPLLLLMDEPTSALDPARRGALGETLRALARQGRALLVATHDVDFARAHADRVAVLHEGVLVEQGPPAEVLDRPAHAATRELLQGASSSPRDA